MSPDPLEPLGYLETHTQLWVLKGLQVSLVFLVETVNLDHQDLATTFVTTCTVWSLEVYQVPPVPLDQRAPLVVSTDWFPLLSMQTENHPQQNNNNTSTVMV